MIADSVPSLPTLLAASATLAAVVLAGSTASGHADDPKAKDKTPIYVGPGYLADADDAGPGGAEFDASGVELLSWITIPEFPGGGLGQANDCWGYVSPSGREYAIFGLECGTGFVDITNPGSAQVLDVLSGPCCTWRDIKTYGEYAYIVSECGLGIQVVDLRQIDQGTITHVGNVLTGGSGSHNVAIDETSGFLYRTGGSGYGLLIYDLNADPEDPPLVGEWPDRYVHDAQIVTYTDGPNAGMQVAFLCAGDNNGWLNPSLDIIDVTDKSQIRDLSSYEYPSGEYSHQGWLSEDKQYFYLGDELDEDGSLPTKTFVFDVSNIQNPVLVNDFTNGSSAVGHNLYTHDGLIFEANYSSGLRIFDTCADPEAPVEIAYFDTRPEDDFASYSGLWSNWPYFPSGVVIGSDRQRGLFVWRLTLPRKGDLDANGVIDFGDLLGLLSAWGDCQDSPCPTDLDCSGGTDFADLLRLLADWGG